MDIQDKNNIIVPNIYLLSLKANIIFAICKCFYITINDYVLFFYQWQVHLLD